MPNITNEVELGLQFIGFWKSFVDTFDIHKYEVYLTGERYEVMLHNFRAPELTCC